MFNKRNVLIIVLFIALTLNRTTESLFVSVGNYFRYRMYGINAPECGYSREPILPNIELRDKCFAGIYDVRPNKSKTVPSGRIRKGHGANPDESPWTAFLQFKLDGSMSGAHTCTGSLITLSWVLTAGHCYGLTKWDSIEIHAGHRYRGSGWRRYVVNTTKFFVHPWYRDKSSVISDIGLIKLDEPYKRVLDQWETGDHSLNTICLPEQGQYNSQPENATLYGYGLVAPPDQGQAALGLYLRKAEFLIKPTKECEKGKCGDSPCYQLCTELEATGPMPCEGDSGGSLVQYLDEEQSRGILIGVLRGSSPRIIGEHCTNSSKEATFTSIAPHIPWILKTIKENF